LSDTNERWAPGRLVGHSFGAARIPGFALLSTFNGGHDLGPLTAFENLFNRADTGAALANRADEVFICLRNGRPWRKAINHFIHAGSGPDAMVRIRPAVCNTAVLNGGIVCTAKPLIRDAKIVVRKTIARINIQTAGKLLCTGGRIPIIQRIIGTLEEGLGIAT
jgi:hypothetical protein